MSVKRIKQDFLEHLSKKSGDWMDKPIPVLIGDEDGLISAGPGLIYVRLINAQVITVLGSLNVYYNWHATIGRLKTSPNVWRIREVRETYLTSVPQSIGLHHGQHEFDVDGNPGVDQVWNDRKSIKQLTVLVSDSAGFIVVVGSGVTITKTGMIGISETLKDLSSYIPSSGAVFVNIEVDEDEVISLHAGANFSAPTLVNRFDYVPIPDFEHYLVGSALLYESQSRLLNKDIFVPMSLGTNYLLNSSAFSDILVSVEDIQSAFEVLDTHTHEGVGAVLYYDQYVYEIDDDGNAFLVVEDDLVVTEPFPTYEL